jgi:hypothetical protein
VLFHDEGGDVEPSTLDLFTTRELIDELIRRKTFLGLVVHAAEELKSAEWTGERVFTVHMNSNFAPAEAGRLLEVIAERMTCLPD